MPGVLLFCTAEEAKPFVPQVLATDGGTGHFPYYLAESRENPAQGNKFTQRLANDETFETDFIGASIEDCGPWALEQQEKNNTVEQDVIVLLDARSAEDYTIIVWFYARDEDADYLGGGQEVNTWHPFRVPYLKAEKLSTDLIFENADESFGVLFHRKDGLTDGNGIFDYDRCVNLILPGEGVVRVHEA
ncbi:hypothetical protein F4782DRAFT_527544 [Xylaria castorea]|nr:hypothetical protein F4782DRAFT_527544 [Xylaria castorea]